MLRPCSRISSVSNLPLRCKWSAATRCRTAEPKHATRSIQWWWSSPCDTSCVLHLLQCCCVTCFTAPFVLQRCLLTGSQDCSSAFTSHDMSCVYTAHRYRLELATSLACTAVQQLSNRSIWNSCSSTTEPQQLPAGRAAKYLSKACSYADDRGYGCFQP